MPVTIISRPGSVNFTNDRLKFLLEPSSFSANKKIQIQIKSDSASVPVITLTYPLPIAPLSTLIVYLDNLLTPYLNYFRPELDGARYNNPAVFTDQSALFWISTRLFDASLTSQEAFVEDSANKFRVIKGGYSNWPNQANFYFENERKWFWTWIRTGKLIGENDANWLFYTHPVEATATEEIAINYTDGTSYVVSTPLTVLNSQSVKLWKQLTIPSGVDQLGLKAYQPNKTIANYSIRILNDTTGERLAAFDYVVDYRSNYDVFLVYFRNSLGGWDNVRLLGEWNEVFDYTRKEFASGEADAAGSLLWYSSTERRKWQVNVGHIEKADIDVIRDMMLSKECALRLGDVWMPVRMTQESLSGRDTRQPLQNVAFEFESAFENESYSPDVLPWI